MKHFFVELTKEIDKARKNQSVNIIGLLHARDLFLEIYKKQKIIVIENCSECPLMEISNNEKVYICGDTLKNINNIDVIADFCPLENIG